MPNRFSLPGIDEVAVAVPLDRLPPTLFPHVPVTMPIKLPIKLPPFLFREIAYFSYAIPGDAGPVDGETTSQEDIFRVSPWTGHVRRVTDDRTLPVMKSDRDPAWSPSRASLAIHTQSVGEPDVHLRVIHALTGAVQHELVPGHTPRWLDASTLLYLASVDVDTDAPHTDVFCVDIPSGTTTRITDVGAGADVSALSWHPTAGLALGYSEYEPTERSAVAVVPAAAVGAVRAGGAPVPRAALTFVTPPALHAASPAWSPAGDRIALATWTPGAASRVGILTVASGALAMAAAPASPTLSDSGPVFSRDGGVVAFARGEEDAWSEIWLWTPGSGALRQLTDDHRTRFKGGLDW